MTHKRFFISDPHFGHENIIKFRDKDDKIIRPFKTLDDMHDCIVENWNRVVRDVDKVYVLGDVVINRRLGFPVLERLKGKKILIKGNHDCYKLKDYLPHFKDIRAYRVFPEHGLIFSHIPVHTHQLQGRFKANVHGHLHQNIIENDNRYLNVCCEHINYTPIEYEEILTILKSRNVLVEDNTK